MNWNPESKFGDLFGLAVNKIIRVIGQKKAISNQDVQLFEPFRRLLRLTQISHLPICQNAWHQMSDLDWWRLTQNSDSTHLVLDEILGSKSEIFSHVVSSAQLELTWLRSLSLSSRAIHPALSSNNKSYFAYEVQGEKLKDDLVIFLRKAPNLSDLTIEAFCDDEILAEIVAQNCPKLKSLKIVLESLSCADNRRLTDDGIIDFIEDSNLNLCQMDLSECVASDVTFKSLRILPKLTHLVAIKLYSEHLQCFDLFFNQDSIHPGVKKLSIVVSLFDTDFSGLVQNLCTVFPNVEKLEIESYFSASTALNTSLGNWRSSVKTLIYDDERILKSLKPLLTNLESFRYDDFE